MTRTRSIVVDWYAFERAFLHNAVGSHAYLDVSSGEVRYFERGREGFTSDWREVTGDPDRFIHIDPVRSEEQHRWMVAFVASLREPELHARLTEAITRARAFRSFNQILREHPEVEEQWLAYRQRHVRAEIDLWLARCRLVALPEPGTAPGATTEEQREVARRILAKLSEADLLCAIAFLLALHQRPDGSRR
jgi:hypothetical protein